MGDFKSFDYRISNLELITQALQDSIDELIRFNKGNSWFDGLHLLESIEPILGNYYVCLQNYINSSIFDKDETLKFKTKRYKLGRKINNLQYNNIQLVVALGNYFKHRDDDQRLHQGTLKIVESFASLENTDISDSPILVGFKILAEDWKLDTVLVGVKTWRAKLWADQE